MTFTISNAAVEALQPARLPGDASLIEYDGALISWPAQGDESNGSKDTIETQDIVLLAEIAGGGYLILTLTEGQPGEEGQEPFRLSSISASHLPQGLLDQHLLHDVPGFLKGVAGSRLDVIVSVRSGTGLAPKFYEAVLRPLLDTLGLSESSDSAAAAGSAAPSYRTTLTKDANTVKEFVKAELGGSVAGTTDKTVILLSGDGAVVDLLNGGGDMPPSTTHPLPTIVLVPLGTGNALFHSLHKPHYENEKKEEAASPAATPTPLVLAVRALLRGRAAPLPTFRATFSPGARLVDGEAATAKTPVAALTGAIVASYGLHSQLVWESDTPAWRRHGAKRFGMVAEELLQESHAYRAVVEKTASSSSSSSSSPDDGGEAVGFNYILATLVSNLERTFAISPAGRPLDGTLRLVRFGGFDGARTMEVMMAAYDGGRHVGMEGVRYEAVADGGEVRITTREADARWRKVCVDGTIVEIPTGGTMTVRKAAEPALRVVVLDV